MNEQQREKVLQAMMAQTEIGTPLPFGRPQIKNPDGSFSTEETLTTQVPPGVWANVPTIHGGARLPGEYVESMARMGLMPHVGVFGSVEDAEAAAQQRTKVLGPWYGGGR